MKYLRCLVLVAVASAGCGQGPRPQQQPAGTPPAPGGLGEDAPKDGAGKGPGHKDVVALTPAAASEILILMGDGKSRYLRVSVSDDHQYKLDLDPNMDPRDDYLGESRGVPVVVDRKSSLLLPAGITVDFVDANGERGFKFISPEADRDPPDTSVSLTEARQGFHTTLARRESGGSPAPRPPADVFRLVRYDAPVGKLAAYLSPDPKDGKKHPAILWITGGDCNSIDEGCWHESAPTNDQSAAAYRKAGMVMMFPSLRGGNDNPGVKEGFLGEVDDVLAAAEFLRAQAYVDPERVYLGGHSTGGTLALLTAECSDRFRAVFSFGPVDDVIGYGPRYNPFAVSDRKELQLRAPGRWLHSVRRPVFVFEGTGGNLSSLQTMARSSKNPNVRFFEVKGANHFSTLAPTNRLIADKILQDAGPACRLAFTEEEVSKPFAK
jgi:Fe-S cluster assembly iron-binding protein IscA